MRKKLVAAWVSCLAAAAAVPASAHHNFFAVFDRDDPVRVSGVIVEVRLTNPHSWFFLDVENEAGEVERWAFEAGTPSGMIRNGYTPDLIRPGEEVTIRGFHARDASNMGMLRELISSDGTVYGTFGQEQAR